MGIPRAAAPARPRSDAGHVRLQQRDLDGLPLGVDHYAAPYDLLGQALGHDRAAMLAAVLPATQADADQRNQQRAEELRLQAAQNETAQNGLITQLAQMGSDTSPAANAMRERITAQFNDLYTRASTIQAELDALTTAQAPAPDGTLIDEFPYAAANLTDAPARVKTMLYDALDIQALYRQPMKQATIWATITDDTPGTIAAVLNDPRTDSDTFGSLQPAPIATSAIHHLRRRRHPLDNSKKRRALGPFPCTRWRLSASTEAAAAFEPAGFTDTASPGRRPRRPRRCCR
jgi:hypothetical protein